MNMEQITSIIRQIMLFVGGWIVAKGWVDNETMLQIVGALAALVASGWAIWTRSNKNLVASAADKVPVPVESQREVGIKKPIAPTT